MFKLKICILFFVLLPPVLSFSQCAGDAYKNCKCVLALKNGFENVSVVTLDYCCKNKCGGYGEKGDSRCCTEPGETWDGSGCVASAPKPKVYTGAARLYDNGGGIGRGYEVHAHLCASDGWFMQEQALPCASRSSSYACTATSYIPNEYQSCTGDRNPVCETRTQNFPGEFQCGTANYPECPAGQTDQQICGAQNRNYKCVKPGTMASDKLYNNRTGPELAGYYYWECQWQSNKCGNKTFWGSRVSRVSVKGTVQYLSCE